MTERGASPTFRLIELDETPSTSSEAMRRAIDGDTGPFWVLAHHQTQGRGRSGRTWTTSRGNLAISQLFEPGCPPAAAPQLSLLAGVAVRDALARFWPEGAACGRLRLKWPNDIMIDRAKIGGLLVETTTLQGRLVCTIGIGINLVDAPEVAGREIASLAPYASEPVALRPVAEAIAGAFEHWLPVWDRGADFAAIRTAWLARAGPAGEPIVVNAGDGLVAGTFAGLDTDGALLLLGADGRRRRFSFGDVTLGRTTT